MTNTLLEELQEEVSPVTIDDIQTVSNAIYKDYESKSEVNLENSTFGNLVSNTLLIAKRFLFTGSYEPNDLVKVEFDSNVVNWLQLRERLIKSPIVLNTNIVDLVDLLGTLNRDVFSNLETTLKEFNKTLSTLINKPEMLTSISGNTGLMVDKKLLVDGVQLGKVKSSIKDQPVTIKIGRIFNSMSEIKMLSGKLHSVNYDYARVELDNILSLHERTVELVQTLVKDTQGNASGNSAKYLVSTMTGLAMTSEALGVIVLLLDKLTLVVNECITSVNEAHRITIEENKA